MGLLLCLRRKVVALQLHNHLPSTNGIWFRMKFNHPHAELSGLRIGINPALMPETLHIQNRIRLPKIYEKYWVSELSRSRDSVTSCLSTAVPFHLPRLTSAPSSSSFTWRADGPTITSVRPASQVELKWNAERKKRQRYFSHSLEKSNFRLYSL